MSLAGIGNSQLMMNALAIAAGGRRKGRIQDNIWFDPKRTRLATNSDLLRRIHNFAEANERKVMSPSTPEKTAESSGRFRALRAYLQTRWTA